ncbi:hypothetical protein K440DRAFT_620294 [Wilcoxina mikolae CBS 423.85]|nr:hypothetical protein K440DRAFT_620294 [Wilcoxina mikolae CBS 423.85]
MHAGVPTEPPSSIPQVVLLGINGDSRPVPTELVQFYSKKLNQTALDKAVGELEPDYISLACGEAFLSRIVDRSVETVKNTDAPLICYKISFTPGISGSPICSPHSKVVFGLHVGAFTSEGT